MTEQIGGMSPQVLVSEIQAAAERLKNGAIVDQKREFVENTYPVLEFLATRMQHLEQHFLGRLTLLEATIAEFLTGQESMIMPDLSQEIRAVLGAGLVICQELTTLSEHVQLPESLRDAMTAFSATAPFLMQKVEAVTAEEGDDDDYDEDEDDDEFDPSNNGEPDDIDDIVDEALSEAKAVESAKQKKAKENPRA